MKYKIYSGIDFDECYWYTAQNRPDEETLIGTIDGKDLGPFITFLKQNGYEGRFKKNKGHFRQKFDLEQWLNEVFSDQDVSNKQFHIFPCKEKELSLAEWQKLAL